MQKVLNLTVLSIIAFKQMTIVPLHKDLLPSVNGGISLFASRRWARTIGDRLRSYAVVTDGGERVASFLLFHSSKWGMGYTITSPLAPHIGLEISIDSIKIESKQSKEKAIHKAIAEFIDAGKDSLVEFSLPTEIIDTQAYTWAGFDVSPRHTYHIDLNQSEEQLLNSMSSERRKNIRKAQEDGLRVEIVRDTDRFRSIVQKTIKRQRISIDQGILDKVLMSEYLDEYRSMYVCSFQGRDLAASLIVHDEHRSYYLIGGYDSSNSHSGAGTLNLWKAILDSKRRANKVFDLEGSMIPEVERYFRGFGGKLKTYFSIERKSTLANIAKRIKGS